MTNPLCKVCGTHMVVRESDYGEFYACPKSYKGNNHGTISIKDEPTPVSYGRTAAASGIGRVTFSDSAIFKEWGTSRSELGLNWTLDGNLAYDNGYEPDWWN